MRRADLHVHTHASSDASFDPEEVFSIAMARGLTAVTFSDHDTIDSIAEGQRLSTIYDVTFLPASRSQVHGAGYRPTFWAFSAMVRFLLWKVFWPMKSGR